MKKTMNTKEKQQKHQTKPTNKNTNNYLKYNKSTTI